MKLTPWRKHSETLREDTGTGALRLFREQMDRLFDSFFGGAPSGETLLSSSAGSWNPDLDVAETDKEIVVRAEMPGLNPEEIDVRVAGNVLTLSGEKKEESEETEGGYYRSERRFGSFYRAVELPPGAKPDSVSAEYDKGILTLKIAKSEDGGTKKIQVRSASAKPAEPRKEPAAKPEQPQKEPAKKR